MKQILSVVLISQAAFAAGLPGILLGDGEWSGAVGARAFAMGGVELMDASALGSLTNPAAAASAGPGITVQLAGGMDVLVEKRTRTVYDSFESSIGEAEHAFNRSSPLIPGGLALTLSRTGGMPDALSIALGWVERASFGYSYDRTIRNDYYVTTGEERLEIDGCVGEACASAAMTFSDLVTVGLGGGWLSGSRDTRWTRNWIDPSIPDTDEASSSDLSGMVGRASVVVSPREDLSVSLGVEKAMSVSWTGDSSGDLELPPRIRAGAEWLPGNALRSRFVAEVSYYAASGAEFDGSDMGMRDCWSACAGLEKHIPGGPACRFGFRYDKSPVSRALDSVSFTGGMGFSVAGMRLDAGASFTPRCWDQQDIPLLPSFADDDTLGVEETVTALRISASRAFSL